MPRLPKKKDKPLRVACVYWYTSAVGGIATHLNSLRTVAQERGDRFDILHSRSWKTKTPQVFSERQWVRGGDTRIWIDGEFSHHPKQVAASLRWLKENYDVIHFGFLCPHPTKAYPTPDFLPVFTDLDLPKTGTITDGYWDDYAEWGEQCIPYLNLITTSGMHYAQALIERGIPVQPLGIPFLPGTGRSYPRDREPLLIWPNQWKNIKGINPFLDAVPSLPDELRVELYSCGIRYYQLRTEDRWLDAVGEDKLFGFHGRGRATYFGNVDLPRIRTAFQRAWFSVCFQGIATRKAAYKAGSYNNTELEALYYGALPILHESALGTDLPESAYRTVETGDELPDVVARALRDGTVKDSERLRDARAFVLDNYSAYTQYETIRKAWRL